MIYTVLISTRLILNLCRIQLFLAISVEIRTSTTIIQYNSAGEGGIHLSLNKKKVSVKTGKG